MSKTKTIVLIVVLLGLLVSRAYFSADPSIHQQVANRVMHKTAKELQRQHEIRLCGKGYEMFGGPIRSLHLSFYVFRPLSKMEARTLVINCVDTFLQNMRNDPDAEAVFHNGPPDYHTASISLYMSQSDGSDVLYPLPTIVSVYKSIVRFTYYDSNAPPPNNQRTEDETETIEEALAIIEQKSQSSATL